MFNLLRKQPLAILGFSCIVFLIIISTFAPKVSSLLNIDPYAQNLFKRYQPIFSSKIDETETQVINNPSYHILGTDELGRDVLIRLIYAARTSIFLGLFVAFFSGFIGLILGAIAGYFGGFVDKAIMRVVDMLMAIPVIPVLIILSAIDLNKILNLKSFFSDRDLEFIKIVIYIEYFFMDVSRTPDESEYFIN